MNLRPLALAALIMAGLTSAPRAETLCTIVADGATGTVLLEQGDCRTRVTPASTFKIPLAVMGFDAAILTDPASPALPFRAGYPDWGGANWTQKTDPTRWMKYSVVWFSQQVTKALGVETLQRYAADFAYGNGDLSGDAGQNNGLERSWISSSLKISPLEQVIFLGNLLNRRLPVSPAAIDNTLAIVETTQHDGWAISGKTGSAYPRLANGNFDRASGWGWYVGWATQNDRTLIFARLDQDTKRHSISGGLRARDQFLAQWPELVRAISTAP